MDLHILNFNFFYIWKKHSPRCVQTKSSLLVCSAFPQRQVPARNMQLPTDELKRRASHLSQFSTSGRTNLMNEQQQFLTLFLMMMVPRIACGKEFREFQGLGCRW